MSHSVCQLSHTHIHTGRFETRLLILIGASQTRAVCGDHSRRARRRNSQRERGKDEAPNECRLISQCLNWHMGQRENGVRDGAGEEKREAAG